VRVEVVVEVPAGSRNTYEMDHRTGIRWLDRALAGSRARYGGDGEAGLGG
jgi:inorganic pyrophosphatase